MDTVRYNGEVEEFKLVKRTTEDRYYYALRSIALSSCCSGCMEAKRVALLALGKGEGELNEEALSEQKCDNCSSPCRDNHGHVHLCDSCYNRQFERKAGEHER